MIGPYLRNPYLLFMTIAVVVVAGLSALIALPQLEDPRITNRFPLVIAPFPGASAERVEALIAEPLETALDEIEEIKVVESVSRTGLVTLGVELVDAVNASTKDDIFARVRTKIEEAATQLPPGAEEPRVDDQLVPVAFTRIAALTWQGEGEAPLGVMTRRAEELADLLRTVSGTELVRVYGEGEEEITVGVDRDELQSLGLSVDGLARRVAAADSRRPAGALRSERSTLLIEVDGALDSLERIRSIPLEMNRSGGALRLGDIATVERGIRSPVDQVSLIDGKRAVLVAARMGKSVRVGPWAEQVSSLIDQFAADSQGPIRTETIFDQSVYTRARLGELLSSLGLGALVVMWVVWLTMGWRLSLLVGSALPLTAAATLFGIFLLGGQIHQMSIFGMIIAMGLLIDNAIVVVDEIRKRRDAGLQPFDAVQETYRHLRGPILASTVTTMLAFAPIVLLPGAAGDFVRYIGISVILAISSSYLLSMTVIAALAGRYGGKPEPVQARRSWWKHGVDGTRPAVFFRKMMAIGLRRPVLAMLLAMLIPIVGFGFGSQLGREFFPPTDRNMFDIQVWLPVDASIDRTESVVRDLEQKIRTHSEVERVFWMAGGSFPSVYYNLMMDKIDTPSYARGVVVVDNAQSTERLVPLLQREIDLAFPGAQVVVRSFGQGPPIDADVQYRVFGPNIEVLQDIGERVRLELQSHPGVLHTQVTMPRGEPKLWFNADEMESERAGLTLNDVAAQLNAGLEGAAGGVLLEDLEQIPVRLRIDGARSSLSELATLRVASAAGSTPLSALGKLDLRPELGGIARYGGERCNSVLGFTAEGELAIEVAAEVLARLDEKGFELPEGYHLALGGSAEEDQEAIGNLLAFAPILATMMLATIVLVFRSLRIAGILMVVAMLSVGLALLSTALIGFPISFNTILGTLGLIGVALNDSIVVLASIRGNPQARRGEHGAILDEVLGCTRHIFSTSLTTMGGFLPLLIFVGGQFWPSLAIVLVGGVGGATLLALVFVPAAYVWVHRSGKGAPIMSPKSRGAARRLGSATAGVTSLIALSLLAVSCTVGPDYQVPVTTVPEEFSIGSGEHALGGDLTSEAQQQAAWWSELGDPQLVNFVEQAMRANHRVEIATARLAEARAIRAARGGRLYPSVSAQVSGGRARASANGPGPLAGLAEAGLASLENSLYTAGFDVAWELDLFGGVRRGIESSQARLEATQENLHGVRLLIAAETSLAYVDYRGAELRRQLAERNLELQQNSMDVIEAKVESGIAAPIDLERSRAEEARLRSAIAPLRAQSNAAANRLAVLTGKIPTGFRDQLRAARVTAFPAPPQAIAAGMPAELLLRRPDVRAAERELQASTADVGAAIADRFPSISMGASLGLESAQIGDLVEGGSRAWSFGPRLDLPLLQGGRLKAQVEVARSRLQIAESNFERTVLVALEEVENGLVGYEEAQRSQDALLDAVQAARNTTDMAASLYELGLRDHLVLLDAQRSQTEIEDAEALARIQVAYAGIRLYLGLGGGWPALALLGEEREGTVSADETHAGD